MRDKPSVRISRMFGRGSLARRARPIGRGTTRCERDETRRDETNGASSAGQGTWTGPCAGAPWQFAELHPLFVARSVPDMCCAAATPSARAPTLLLAGNAAPSYQKFPFASVYALPTAPPSASTTLTSPFATVAVPPAPYSVPQNVHGFLESVP